MCVCCCVIVYTRIRSAFRLKRITFTEVGQPTNRRHLPMGRLSIAANSKGKAKETKKNDKLAKKKGRGPALKCDSCNVKAKDILQISKHPS